MSITVLHLFKVQVYFICHLYLYVTCPVETNVFELTSKLLEISLADCRSADIAFLLDGSGSVSRPDFNIMKIFVKNLVRSLLPLDTKVTLWFHCPVNLFLHEYNNYSTSWLFRQKNAQLQFWIQELTVRIAQFNYILKYLFPVFFSLPLPNSPVIPKSISTSMIFSLELDHGNRKLITFNNKGNQRSQLEPLNMWCKCRQHVDFTSAKDVLRNSHFKWHKILNPFKLGWKDSLNFEMHKKKVFTFSPMRM